MAKKNNVIMQPNSNFHFLYRSEDAKKTAAFEEYRRKWFANPVNFEAGDFPLNIDIEATSRCNLRCPFCATTYMPYKKGFMDFDIFKKIIDEGAEYALPAIKLNYRGEPLLHPRTPDMVRYAKEKGVMDVYFNTNGVLLTADISGRLIEAGLDRISVSFEGTEKEFYEKNRVGSDYDTVLNNIKTLQRLKKDRGVNHPRIRVQTVLLAELRDRLREYTAFWKEHADEIGYLDLKDEPARHKGLVYAWACPQLWQRLTITFDGTILPCVHDAYQELALGNVKDTSLWDAWTNEKLERIREAHKKGLSHEINACDGCSLRTSEVLKLREKEEVT